MEVVKHQRDRLQQSLVQIQKQRAPKKQLLVPGLPEMGQGGFISPSKVERSRVYIAEEEAREAREIAEKEDRRVQKQLASKAKAEELETQRKIREQEAQERVKRKAEEREQIEARKTARAEAAAKKKAASEAKQQEQSNK